MKEKFTEVKDSGKRQEFSTGSVRDTQMGKGRYDLVSTIALKRLARHYENGSRKYSCRNWEKGQPLSRYLDSAMRHLAETIDGSDEEDVAAAVMWNMAAFIHTKELIDAGILPQELNDMKEYWETQKKYRNYLNDKKETSKSD